MECSTAQVVSVGIDTQLVVRGELREGVVEFGLGSAQVDLCINDGAQAVAVLVGEFGFNGPSLIREATHCQRHIPDKFSYLFVELVVR